MALAGTSVKILWLTLEIIAGLTLFACVVFTAEWVYWLWREKREREGRG